MNKKGFTLVELLGVIVILGILVTIITVSVDGVLDTSKNKLTEVQIEKLKQAAKNYYITEGMTSVDFEQSEFNHCVNINYLIENGYVDESEISNFETNENMLGSIRLSYNSKKYEYEYSDDTCQVCKPVTNETKTTGNIPADNYLSGDEYICEVKNNAKYHFFVVSTDNDNVNLIMDRNIYYDETNDVGMVATETNNGLVAWNSEAWSKYGPVTAMDYLYNATKTWNNIPNIVINYTDEGNYYGTITTTNNVTKITNKDGNILTVLTDKEGYKNLKSRMPMYSEVTGEGKCTTTDGSCPLWLVNYMSKSSYYKAADGKIDISGINGYWTFSADDSSGAWRVSVDVSSAYVGGSGNAGVRPVISLSKEFIQSKDRW
jgi:prepilin-type N-terminal cleavage/methylation domain-containing protein